MDYARYRCLRATRQGRILVLALDRPPMNAVDAVLHAELATIFADVGHDAETDVVVLTGTGRAFSAGGDTAWFRHVAAAAECLPRAMELARRLADGPMLAIRWTKLSVNKLLKASVNLVLDASLALEVQTFRTEDHQEAVRAFDEKRPARFHGR